ncbi:hypothetical protein EON81_30170 [bacterium]|nr:MAG: hypothetical protein EON81_30170 [bacterium]
MPLSTPVWESEKALVWDESPRLKAEGLLRIQAAYSNEKMQWLSLGTLSHAKNSGEEEDNALIPFGLSSSHPDRLRQRSPEGRIEGWFWEASEREMFGMREGETCFSISLLNVNPSPGCDRRADFPSTTICRIERDIRGRVESVYYADLPFVENASAALQRVGVSTRGLQTLQKSPNLFTLAALPGWYGSWSLERERGTLYLRKRERRVLLTVGAMTLKARKAENPSTEPRENLRSQSGKGDLPLFGIVAGDEKVESGALWAHPLVERLRVGVDRSL